MPGDRMRYVPDAKSLANTSTTVSLFWSAVESYSGTIAAVFGL